MTWVGRSSSARPTGHKCLEAETLEVARVIGAAARDLGLSANNVVDEAFERHMDVIHRLILRG